MPPVSRKGVDNDFVSDYVAKKQAQMQRAREIREERSRRTEEQEQEQQQEQRELYSHEHNQTEFTSEEVLKQEQGEHNASQELTKHKRREHSSANRKDRCILQVVEEDFTKATQAGIITPDQARQLWAMFSDQVIRVEPGEPHINSTVSIESLLTLSNNTLTSATSSLGSVDVSNSLKYNATTNSNNSTTASTGFGGSISLESLRQSIANFKKEQHRKGNNISNMYVENKQNDMINDSNNNVNNDNNENVNINNNEDEDDDVFYNSGQYLRSTSKQNSFSAKQEASTSEDVNSNNVSKKRIRKQPLRPEWNFDVEVPNAHEQHDKQLHEQASAQNTANIKNTAAGTAAAALVKKTEKRTSKPAKDANTGQRGNKKTGNALLKKDLAFDASLQGKRESKSNNTATTTNIDVIQKSIAGPTMSTGTNSRNSYSTNNSGSVLNLDDMPVGKTSTNLTHGGTNLNNNSSSNNVFASWDNAFPASQSGSRSNFSSASPFTGLAGNVSGTSNEMIEHEASVAAQEPLRECSICGRSFRVSVLQRHEGVCRKQANKQRKTFDMQSQRLEGVEGMNEVRKTNDTFSQNWAKKSASNNNCNTNNNNTNTMTAARKMPKWKIEHEQFQAAMRAAHVQSNTESIGSNGSYGVVRDVLGRNVNTGLPPPPAPLPPELDNRILCPHCGRKFAEETAKRHIPKCATTIAKPKGIRPIRR